MNLKTLFLCLMLSFCIETNQKNITLEAKTPIIFGGDAELNCNIPCCLYYSKCQSFWHVNRTKKIVYIHVNEQSRYLTKYEILMGQQSCKLIIKNFEPSDLNTMYSFTSYFYSISKMLTLEEDSFELRPNNETMTVRDMSKRNFYSINVTFTKIFPKPKCNAAYNENNLTSDIISRSHRNGIFYWYSIEISVHREVEGLFLMTCKIGEFEQQIKEVAFHLKDSNFALPVAITVIITFPITIVLVMLLQCMLRRRNITWDKGILDYSVNSSKS